MLLWLVFFWRKIFHLHRHSLLFIYYTPDLGMMLITATFSFEVSAVFVLVFCSVIRYPPYALLEIYHHFKNLILLPAHQNEKAGNNGEISF